MGEINVATLNIFVKIEHQIFGDILFFPNFNFFWLGSQFTGIQYEQKKGDVKGYIWFLTFL